MTIFIRLLIISSLVLLSGCASVESYETVKKLTKVTPNIAYAPVIDVPYSEVINSNNIGLKVRWGGEIVKSSKINDSITRLTIAASPLTVAGRPIEVDKTKQNINYFAVDLNDEFSQSVDLNGHLVTLYGDVSEQKTVSINNQRISVPSIELTEIVDWDLIYREGLAQLRRQDPSYYYNVKPHSYSRGGFGHGFHSGLGRSSRGNRLR